jgi:hypothetical protein
LTWCIASRRLVQLHGATFEPDLAGALTNLSVMLSDLGLQRDALSATSQAVDIRRRLAAANPVAFEPDLVRGLWVFARVRAAGQVELPQALTAALESVVLFEGLCRKRPPVLTGDLRGAWRPWPTCTTILAVGTPRRTFATESTPSNQPSSRREAVEEP